MFAFYLDMDGVLADFDAGVKALGFTFLGDANQRRAKLSPELREQKKQLYLKIRNTDFFKTLPLMPGALELWNFCAAHGLVSVLTAIPKFDKEVADSVPWHKARQQKAEWIVGHMPLPAPFTFIGTTSKEKPKFINTHPGHQVLIDDREDNCNDWAAAGGTAIHHTNPAETMRILKQMVSM